MNPSYTLIPDLESLIGAIQPESIVSRPFYRGDHVKATLFGFDAGQELSEHTSSQTAIIQIVKGQATITLGDDHHELTEGCWLLMPPNLKHSVLATSTLILMLIMLRES